METENDKNLPIKGKGFYPTIFTAIDLELNQPSNKIIQIGAAVGDITTGKIISTFSQYINPNEPINPVITELTKITDEIARAGTDLLSAYMNLVRLHLESGAFINPITWGGGDSEFIKKQLTQLNQNFEWCFGRRWIDVKTIVSAVKLANKRNVQGGLARSMASMGIAFAGTKHNAKDDAVNTFLFFKFLLDKMPTGIFR